MLTRFFATLMGYIRRTTPVWLFVWGTTIGSAVVGVVVAQSTENAAADASGCVTAAMTAAERAAAKQLTVADYRVLMEQFPIDAVEYCRLAPTTLHKAIAIAHKHADREQQSGAGGLWLRLERSVERVMREVEGESEEAEGKAAPPDPEYFRLRYVDENGVVPPLAAVNARAHIQAMRAAVNGRAAGINKTSWTSLGPGNIGGRVRALVIHPTNTAILYAGGVAGGVWKSSNSGASWTNLNDFMSNMAVTTLAIDPNNASIIYAGTGEGNSNEDATRGDGIMVSRNAGVTWTQLASTTGDKFDYVNKILPVKVGAKTVLFAATTKGIAKSTNNGTSWTWWSDTVGTRYKNYYDIEVLAADPTKMLVGGYGKIWLSTNSGTSWKAATGLPATGKSIELAWSKSAPLTVYASVDISSGAIYKSTNGGVSFALVSTPKVLESQGWYDNTLWVDPTNPNYLIVGGVDLYRSSNAGKNFTRISDWSASPISAHADHHIIVADPKFNGTTNKKLYFGNDGGVYRANNYQTVANYSGWTELNNTLGITQFFSVRGDAASGQIVGGTQDNGNLASTIGATENWEDFTGGDGGFVAMDPVTPTTVYTEYVYLGYLSRCTNGDYNSCVDLTGMKDDGSWKATQYVLGDAKNQTSLFIAPFILDPNVATTMLAGGASLWRSTDIKAAVTNTTGPRWEEIKTPSGSDYYDSVSAIAVAPGNSDIIWVGNAVGGVWKSSNGTGAAGSVSWASFDAALPNRYVSSIVIDAADSNIVYVVFGGFSAQNIWKTTDGGTTWAATSGTGASALPALPIWSVAIHPTHANWVYVGTDMGIFTSEDSGATWQAVTDGPANVPVFSLSWMGNTLLAGTHGRGIFKSDTNNP